MTNSFGTAELELNTNDGQVVPKILRGDLVQIFQGTELVLSGGFNDDGSFDTGIINGGASGSALISASSETRTISYHCNVHPEMRGTLQVIHFIYSSV